MSNLYIRRVINGKVYDTETATEVTRIPCHVYGDDFEWEDTRVFLSPHCQWFLAGRGNGASRWRVKTASGYVPGDGLVLLTEGEVKELFEQHDGPYEDHFEVVEG